jgi:hypothetical protein
MAEENKNPEQKAMEQGDFTGVYCSRPQNFAWFLGAGSSRASGLPTATDILWDLKRRYYCQQENQDISRQDIQNVAVRERIQAFMDSRGFPVAGSHGEYLDYFERIFGTDKERQRKYLKAILSEEKVTLSVGNRVLGALMACGLCRTAFTTNFDSVVEKSLAAVAKQSLSAYHLEGSAAAVIALDNEEYPIYCKLHGDFRHDSLKNLPDDLRTQNESLSAALVNAANRFGFVVAGYSGRDASIMRLFHAALASHNPFPHGLFWTGIKGSPVPAPVEDLLQQARARGVNAYHVPIETFDALLLRLWRNLDAKPAHLDAEVRKGRLTTVSIPLPPPGKARAVLRLNALPILSLPKRCQSLKLKQAVDWPGLRALERRARGSLILTRGDAVLCWGTQDSVRAVFGESFVSSLSADLPENFALPGNQYIEGFLESALTKALARNRPLQAKTTRYDSVLIADARPEFRDALAPIAEIVGATSGKVSGLKAPATDEYPEEEVTWAEAARISVEYKDDRAWLLIDPDIWISPKRARKGAVSFLDQRRADRFNAKYNDLLDAWIRVILATDQRDVDVTVQPFDGGTELESPQFRLGSRSAFSRGKAQ